MASQNAYLQFTGESNLRVGGNLSILSAPAGRATSGCMSILILFRLCGDM
jgi:hypothetical protein